MSQQKKQWGAIIVMIALFAMIAFVTNLCSPMATIIKSQGEISNVLAQIGNYGNFIAYLIMGIPAGMLISKFGYKKTALIGLVVGIAGILLQWFSGKLDVEQNLGLVFGVYLAGAFIAGLCMCILNCVVNPMLNILGGGGNKGNQLIQIGGVFNSSAAVAVYIIMGALIGEATKAKIADATPALMIALAIFVVAFIVLLFTKIKEPERVPVDMSLVKGAFKYRHFVLGILGIFLYMGIEVGVPTYILQYLPADTPEVLTEKKSIIEKFNAKEITSGEAALAYLATSAKVPNKAEEIAAADKAQKEFEKLLKDTEEKIAPTKEGKTPEITVESISKTPSGYGMKPSVVNTLVALYWLMMLIGRFLGGAIGGKISSRTMITAVSCLTLVLVLFGMYAPTDNLITIPGIDWATLTIISAEVPMGIIAFLFVGLCTSVMWGGIFNMAVEGLGKYTAVASGIFMTMVFGCAVMLAIQGFVADMAVSYLTSYWVVIVCAAYILFYALIGSKPAKVKE